MTQEGCIVVIGGGGGIGRALLQRLTSHDRPCVVASRDGANHGNLDVECEICDARSFDQVDALLKNATERHGSVSGLVNLAGSIILKPAHMINETEWSETIATNLTTAFATVRAAGKHMRQGGSVVLVSTVAAATGLPNHEAIAAAKAGVEGLARSAAATYATRKLRCNVVAPGLVDTPLAERITKSEKTLEHSRKMHPLGRIGLPDDVAAGIEFLLSSHSDWMTGQVIGIDGGLGSTRAGAV
jgi:3-oxoacyl-[acyl-carrier protein] reductase